MSMVVSVWPHVDTLAFDLSTDLDILLVGHDHGRLGWKVMITSQGEGQRLG